MRPAIPLFFLALLLFPANSLALSEYGFLLEPKNVSFSFYALGPKPCTGFLNADLSLAKNARSDFAFEKASQAMRDLGKAKAYAVLQPRILNKGTLAAYRQYSVYCFVFGLKALREASEAVRKGLEIIDSDSKKLERMIGPNFQGFAGGIVAELGEAKRDIENRNSLGAGFGSEFSKTIPLVNQTLTSQAIAKGVMALAGAGGLFEKEITLDDKTLQAIFLLEREFQGLSEENKIFESKFRFLESLVSSEKLAGVGENAFNLVGDASTVASEEFVESFDYSIKKAEEHYKQSAEKTRLAKADWQEKGEGYASRAIERLSSANSALKASERLLEEVIEKSEVLESKLKQAVLREKSEIEGLLSSANPFSAARARGIVEKAFQPKPLSTRGERILFYASNLVELKRAREILEETPSEQALEFSLREEISSLKELLSRAKKDSDFEAEEQRLGEIELSSYNTRLQQTLALHAQLAELKSRVLARLSERYSGLQEKFEKASLASPYFSTSFQEKVGGLSKHFGLFGIDVEKSAGELKAIERELQDLLSQIASKTPLVLKQHLQEQASVERAWELPVSGGKTRVSVKIVLKNRLPLSWEKRMQLDFEVPAQAEVTWKSEEITVGKNVFIEKISEEGEYSLEYETLEEIVEIESVAVESSRADLQQAVVQEKIVFSSKEDTQAVVVLEKQHPIEFAEADFASTVFFSQGNRSQVRILVDAKKGLNSIGLTTMVPNAVSSSISQESLGNATRIALEFRNNYFELQEFLGELVLEGCEGKASASNQEGLGVSAENQGGTLVVEVEARHFEKLETKKVQISLDCIAGVQNSFPQQNAQDKPFDAGLAKKLLEEIEKIEKECEKCVFAAKKFLLLGDLKAASGELEKAKLQALEEREKDESERQAFETALEEFQKTEENALGVLDAFEKAFEPAAGDSKEVAKSSLFQQGKKAAGEIGKILKSAEKAKTPSQLRLLLERLELKAASLEEIVSQQKHLAKEEIENAELKQRQLGNDETLAVLKQSKEFDENGNSFTAWFTARRLNTLFDAADAKNGGQERNAIVLGIAGALVLIALAAFFLRNKATQLQED